MQPADYEPWGATGVRVALQDVGEEFRRRSGNREQDVCVEWRIQNADWNYAAAGLDGGMRTLWIPKKPERAVATKVVAGAFPQFWFLLGHLKPGVSVKEAEADFTVVANPIVEGISEGLSEAFHGATGVADEPGGG